MSSDHLSVLPLSFQNLDLNEQLLKALDHAGYKTPTPIQAEMIPHVLTGRDVVGQAQTGTGKTAAFALPLLQQLRPGKASSPQILVLTPTRELAIQVAEAFESYGKYIKQLRVLAIYGGQDYAIQLRQLDRGVQVVVGTPGRIMDHIRRRSLNLSSIHSFVLDEADEMLKMGFIDDVEWILEQAPENRQIALFSATMPTSIRKIAQQYLKDPIEITIKTKTATATTINQRFLIANGYNRKFEALNRILEVESLNGMLVFVRTKMQTVELAEQLAGLGYACAPLNGDIAQSQRLRTVEQLKSGKLDILIATDVAARGLDVERISHVINFDIPFDTEAYIHRIGRTGRAGRTGEAILFVNPREKHMLKSIERLTKQKISAMEFPTIAEINTKRITGYKQRITETLSEDCSFFASLVEEYCLENSVPTHLVAAALAKMAQGKTPLLLSEPAPQTRNSRNLNNTSRDTRQSQNKDRKSRKPARPQSRPEKGMDRYRIEVGDSHGVKPGNIVGAIANEADLSSEHIGRISIFDTHSTVDLPYGMPPQVLRLLNKIRINERLLRLSKEKNHDSSSETAAAGPSRPSTVIRKAPGGTSAKGARRKGQQNRKASSFPSR